MALYSSLGPFDDQMTFVRTMWNCTEQHGAPHSHTAHTHRRALHIRVGGAEARAGAEHHLAPEGEQYGTVPNGTVVDRNGLRAHPPHMSQASEKCRFGCQLGIYVQTWGAPPLYFLQTASARLKLVEDAIVRDRQGVPVCRF
eukprot:gene18701-biopygen2444